MYKRHLVLLYLYSKVMALLPHQLRPGLAHIDPCYFASLICPDYISESSMSVTQMSTVGILRLRGAHFEASIFEPSRKSNVCRLFHVFNLFDVLYTLGSDRERTQKGSDLQIEVLSASTYHQKIQKK